MSVCVHGNLCRDIYKKTGFIYSKKCPDACPYFEEKYKQDDKVIEDIKADIEKAMEDFYYDEHDLGVRSGFRFALEIIDNHKREIGGENE